MSARAIRYRPRRRRVLREPAPPTFCNDGMCDGCASAWGSLWRLRTTRGRALKGQWCNGCVMEREAAA